MTSLPSELNMYATENARRNLVKAYRKSGLSQKVFCEQHGVKASTFKNWYYRYPECSQSGAPEVEMPHHERTLDPSVLFKAINVHEDVETPEVPTVSSPRPKAASIITQSACLEPTRSSSPNIRIECSAFHISVPTGFDAATLHGILSIMQTLP